MASKRKSKFNPDVLNDTDDNGDLIKLWCTGGFKSEEALCVICNIVINCSQHGITAVKRHAISKGHREKCKKFRNSSGQLQDQTKSQTFITSNISIGNSAVLSHKDIVASAEIKYTIAIGIEHIPYSSGALVSNLFPDIFSDSKIAREFSCSRTKLSYTISDGLGPFFRNQVINEIHKTNCHYSIQIDETPIPEKRNQQMDVIVRYYSDMQKMVVCEHLNSYHLGSATANIMLNCIEETLLSLPKNKFLCFFSDGPNVMKSLYLKLKTTNNHILDVGKCSLHKVHNAFSAGLNVFEDVEAFCLDVYYFFKHSAVRSEDWREKQSHLGLPDHVFLRHVQSRWLTLQLSVERVIEQFDALNVFFENYSAKGMRDKSEQCQRICRALKDKTFRAKLLFIKNAAELFTGFLRLFQQQGPLIHILYDEMNELLKRVLGRFLLPDTFKGKNGIALKQIDVEKGWLTPPEIGLDTQRALLEVSDSERKLFFLSARSFYKACAKKLMATLPLDNKVLQYLQCLHPLSRTEEFSVKAIRFLASQMPSVLESSQVSALTDEWRMLQAEDIDSSMYLRQNKECKDDVELSTDELEPEPIAESKFERVDIYWTRIFALKNHNGNAKYVLLTKVIKALLCLPHGNADVERGFSQNNHILNGRSKLNIHSINGLRHMQSYMKRYNGDCRKLPITCEMLKCTRQASQNYRERIAKEKCKRTHSSTPLENEDKEGDQLVEKERNLKQQLEASQKMLGHAEKLIADGLSSKDFSKIASGQVILQDSKEKLDKYFKDLKTIQEKLASCNAMKKKKITS